MSKYSKEFANTFEESVKYYIKGTKTKRVFEKALFLITENPYHKTKKVEGAKGYNGLTLLRKHICGEFFRIFYSVDESNEKIIFYFVRSKNKKTYKHF